MTVNPNWSRRVRGLASGSSLELIQWVRDAGAQLNSEQYISKFSGKSPNSLVTGAPGDICVNVSLTSGSPGDLWTQQASTVSRSGWTRLVSSAAGGSGAPVGTAFVIVGKDATGNLTSARSLAAGANITFTDGGAASILTINSPILTSLSTASVTGTWTSDVSASNVTFNNAYASDGTPPAPSIAFKSEVSLGWYRSGASVMQLSYGTVAASFGSFSRITGAISVSTTEVVGSWTTNSIVGSWTTNSIVGSWTTNSIVGSWTTNSIVGTWTSDVSSSNISVNDLNIADGTALAPSFDYKSEQSLGFYRSASSVVALSYGTLSPSAMSVRGLTWMNGPVVVGTNTANFGAAAEAFFICSSLTSSDHNLNLFGLDVEPTFSSTATGVNSAVMYTQLVTAASGITFGNIAGLLIDGPSIGAGSKVSIVYGLKINNQTGAATSNYAILTGTGLVQFGDNVWCTSGISVGSSANTGSLIPAISSTSSKIAAMVVNGSSTSFVVVTWAAVKAGDIITNTPYLGAARSSLSSGLVAHSHCTQAGQFEFRLSNVSTLVQNQSAQTWAFVRITPF